jgi:hypothetical protein
MNAMIAFGFLPLAISLNNGLLYDGHKFQVSFSIINENRSCTLKGIGRSEKSQA